MITFWCHQPKQFPKMGTRERLPTEGTEGNEKKAIFKDSKWFYFESLASILVPIVSIRMGWGPTLSGAVRVRYPCCGNREPLKTFHCGRRQACWIWGRRIVGTNFVPKSFLMKPHSDMRTPSQKTKQHSRIRFDSVLLFIIVECLKTIARLGF